MKRKSLVDIVYDDALKQRSLQDQDAVGSVLLALSMDELLDPSKSVSFHSAIESEPYKGGQYLPSVDELVVRRGPSPEKIKQILREKREDRAKENGGNQEIAEKPAIPYNELMRLYRDAKNAQNPFRKYTEEDPELKPLLQNVGNQARVKSLDENIDAAIAAQYADKKTHEAEDKILDSINSVAKPKKSVSNKFSQAESLSEEFISDTELLLENRKIILEQLDFKSPKSEDSRLLLALNRIDSALNTRNPEVACHATDNSLSSESEVVGHTDILDRINALTEAFVKPEGYSLNAEDYNEEISNIKQYIEEDLAYLTDGQKVDIFRSLDDMSNAVIAKPSNTQAGVLSGRVLLEFIDKACETLNFANPDGLDAKLQEFNDEYRVAVLSHEHEQEHVNHTVQSINDLTKAFIEGRSNFNYEFLQQVYNTNNDIVFAKNYCKTDAMIEINSALKNMQEKVSKKSCNTPTEKEVKKTLLDFITRTNEQLKLADSKSMLELDGISGAHDINKIAAAKELEVSKLTREQLSRPKQHSDKEEGRTLSKGDISKVQQDKNLAESTTSSKTKKKTHRLSKVASVIRHLNPFVENSKKSDNAATKATIISDTSATKADEKRVRFADEVLNAGAAKKQVEAAVSDSTKHQDRENKRRKESVKETDKLQPKSHKGFRESIAHSRVTRFLN